MTAPPGDNGADEPRKTRSQWENFFWYFRFRGAGPGGRLYGNSTKTKSRGDSRLLQNRGPGKPVGLAGQSINQLTRDGVIKRRDTPAGKRYNVVESVRAYTKYLRDKAAGRAEKGVPEDKELEKFEAEVKIKKAKADIAELEAQELQGIMHRSEDVAVMTEDLIYTVRDSLLALPGRLAVDVAGAGTAAEAAEIVKREVYAVMKELSQYQYDPAKYAERVRDRMDWEGDVDDGE